MTTSVLITLVLGFAVGFLLRRLGLPAGGLVGSFLAVAVFSVVTGAAVLPAESRIVVQIVAGAFVGCSLDRDDIRSLHSIAKPALFMVLWYLAFVLAVGGILFAATSLNLPTALMSCVPGGISDVPVVAASMGADAPAVTLLQLLRLLLGIGLMPIAVKLFVKKEHEKKKGNVGSHSSSKRQRKKDSDLRLEKSPSGLVPEIGPEASAIDLPDPTLSSRSRRHLFLSGVSTLVVATAAGFVGQATGIPGMTFTTTIVCVLIFNLKTNFAFVPKWLKRLCQYLAGTYLGTRVTAADVAALPDLALPAVIIVVAYLASFLILGVLEHKLFHFTKTEGLLIATPAGASDMALIMDDLGISNTQVVLIQVVRLMVVLAVFPQVINIVLYFAGG